MKTSLKNQILLFCFMIFGLQCLSQTFELAPKTSVMTVKGSSSLHDWEMKVGRMNGNIELEVMENEIGPIEKLSFSVLANSLDGGKSGMNKDAYEALKADTYKTIDFEFEKLNSVNCTSGDCKVNISGTLTVSGVKRSIDVAFDANPSEEQIIFSGSKSLKMTDFNVEPPRAFLGLIRAYDNVIVEFELVFLRESP